MASKEDLIAFIDSVGGKVYYVVNELECPYCSEKVDEDLQYCFRCKEAV